MGQRVIILGGGFGGLYAARTLGTREDVEVTLIDRRNFHLFQPLLYQVATGELSPADVAFPLRAILSNRKNTRVILGEVSDIDPVKKELLLADGASEPYDWLIVSTGARNHYFGHDAWAEHAPGLKSLEEATNIRHRILYAFEAAEREMDPEEHRAWLTFVVVGGGPTGVELAGALGEIANDTLKGDFRHVNPKDARILLVDAADRLLSPFQPSLSAAAEQALIDLGVRSIVNVMVTSVDENGVTLKSADGTEQRIHAHTVLWAAGVAGSAFGAKLADRLGIALQRGGRVPVDDHCNPAGHPEIFVIGDVAYQTDAKGNALPGVAPVAMQQGPWAAKAILSRIAGQEPKAFRYFDKGSLAVIGRASAVAQLPGLNLTGLLAWLAWLFIHLMFLVGFQNRLIVFIRWAFNYFTYNRGARLITGDISPAERDRKLARNQPGV